MGNVEKISIPVSEYKELLESKTINEFLRIHKAEMNKILTASLSTSKEELRETFRPLFDKISMTTDEPDDSPNVESSFHPSDKEKAILNYIKQNPNKSKQDIVNKFKSSYSRVTVFKILDSLSKYEMILVSQDPENRQTHKIVFNERSLLLGLMRETDQLKHAFFNVLNKLQAIVKRNAGNEIYSKSIVMFLGDLVQLYRNIIDQYIMKMMFDWSRKTANKNVLTRAYTISFSSLSSILFEIASLYQKCSNKSMPFETMYADLYEPDTSKDLKVMEDAQNFAKDFKIKHDVNSLIEICRVGLSSANS